MSTNPNHSDINQLQSFLRGEISAVETYRSGLEKAEGPTVRKILQGNLDSHQTRVALLQGKIASLGGELPDGAGLWGTFAKAVEGGAKLFGESAAVAALEEGEDHGLSDYRDDLKKLSPSMQTFVRTDLLPRQQATHDALSALKKAMAE